MNQPKVSILIPCYNSEPWIAEAISSALNQTYINKEVIVVDDGSTDSSLEIIRSFGDRIHWETGENKGGNVARNRLLELSTGEWLQYLDSDDYLKPDKIEKQIQIIQEYPGVDIVYSPIINEYIHADGTVTQETLIIPEPHDPWILLARWFLPQTNSPLWRKQAIIDVGKWKINQPCCQEHELYLRLLISQKKFRYYGYPSSIYRQWSELTVCKKDKSEVFRRRLEIEDKIETYLNQANKLSELRLHAINQARFECARLVWQIDKDWAKKIIEKIKLTDPRFNPTGNAAPNIYKIIYSFFGFRFAEMLADFMRSQKYINGKQS